jgi:type II secretory pathway component PulF
MSLFVTPGQHARRADLYHQLGQLTAAGIGIVEALEIQQRAPPRPSFRKPLADILAKLSEGASLGEAVESARHWLTSFDIALLDTGERTGRLSATFQLLAEHYTSRAALLRQSLSGLMYPAFLFHFAILIGPLPDLIVKGDVLGYLITTLSILVPLYGIVGLAVYAMQGRHGEAWRGLVESILHRVPVVGVARRSIALAQLSSALEALVSAGITILEAWPLAAAASGSPALRRVVANWQPRLAGGVTPADVLANASEFPDLFSSMYRTGEYTGKLDDTLRRLHALYLDEGQRKFKALAEWLPKIAYLMVAAMIAWRVVSFYSGLYKGYGL